MKKLVASTLRIYYFQKTEVSAKQIPHHKAESNASYCKIERISHTIRKDLAAINKEKLNPTFKKRAPVFPVQVIREKIFFCQQHQVHLR